MIGLPHTAVRCISYKDSKAVHRGILLGTVVVAVLMFGMHGRRTRPRGVAGSQDPRSGDPDADDHRAAAVRRRDLLAAPMAAIMSTINAQLLQSSATIIRISTGVRPQQIHNERLIKRFSSLTTLILGLLVLLARRPPEMIIWLNLLAFGGLEAVFLWPLVLGLYWERANAQGALSSMVSGAVCYTLLASFNLQPAGLHPIVPSLLLSLLAFYLGNVVGEKRRAASSLPS